MRNKSEAMITARKDQEANNRREQEAWSNVAGGLKNIDSPEQRLKIMFWYFIDPTCLLPQGGAHPKIVYLC